MRSARAPSRPALWTTGLRPERWTAGLRPAPGIAGLWPASVFLLLAVLSTSALAQPAPLPTVDPTTVTTVYIALTVESPLSPYDHVRYEVRNRGNTLLVSLSKELSGAFGELQDVALVSLDELPAFLDALRTCGFDSLDGADAPPASPSSPMLRLEVTLDDFSRAVAWPAAAAPPGSPMWCSAQLVVDLYGEIGDPVPFQNLFWTDGEFGLLNTGSTPAARLLVDGRDTGLVTPIFGLRLAPGPHVLRYVNDALAIDREYDVTIVVGHTTQLDVELR